MRKSFLLKIIIRLSLHSHIKCYIVRVRQVVLAHYETGMEVESKNLQTYRNLTIILYLLNVVMNYLD